MKLTKKKIKLASLIGLAILSIYPTLIIGAVWWKVLQSPLPGGRHGPLDAYRHTLASAYVSFTLGDYGPSCVGLVSDVMERVGGPSNLMDRHNNQIGAKLGEEASKFDQLDSLVEAKVNAGKENSPEIDKITWLPMDEWVAGRFW